MSVMHPDVDWLLDYEIRLSSRYRRFVSLVMVSGDAVVNDLDQVLSEAIRSSDIFFPVSGGLSVVMGETGNSDAQLAIQRYSHVINESMDVNYSVASYPSDGKTPQDLKLVAEDRMRRAKALGSGAVVAEG